MNNQELMLKVENLIRDKQYDKRFVPMIKSFFLLYNKAYDLDEKELDAIIQNYSNNVDKIEFFNIGRDKNIIEISRRALIFDTSYSEGVDENNIDKYLSQSIISQATAVEMLEVTSKSGEKLIQLNATNNLRQEKNTITERLFKMLVASYGTKETRITQIIKKFEDEYNKFDNDRNNPKRHYYDDMVFNIYKYIKDNFEMIYDQGEPSAEICKRIYAFCLYNLEERINALGREEQDVANYQIIKKHIKEIQKEYNIADEELTNITIEDGWQLPAGNIESRIISRLGITEEKKQSIEEQTSKVPAIKRDKLIEMINEQIEEKPVTQGEIENSIKQMAIENQYPIESISILNEYFKRSVQIYGWDRYTLQKKIENFKLNVKEISLSKIKKSSVQGQTDQKKKKLELRKEIIANDTSLGIIFHEMRHATDYTIRDSILYEQGSIIEDKANDEEIQGLDEMLVEGGTQLLTGTQYIDKLHTTLKLKGYEDSKYILSMLSSTIGLSEIEFLKLGEKGIVKLKEAICDMYQNDDIGKDINEIDQKIQILVDETYAFRYRKEKAILLGQIYNICQEMYNIRIEQHPPSTREEQLKARYEEYKVNKNILLVGKSIGFNKTVFEQEVGSSINQIKDKSKLKREERIYIMSEIVSKQENIRWDNTNAIKDFKLFIKALRREKSTKENNLLPPVKSDFINSLKVEQEYDKQGNMTPYGQQLSGTDLIVDARLLETYDTDARKDQAQE